MKKYLISIIIGLGFLVVALLVFLPEEETVVNLEPALEIDFVKIDIEKIDNEKDLTKELDSAEKIISYLSLNYTLKSDELVARDLETIVLSDDLSIADFSYLSSYLLKNIGIEPGIIRYDYNNNTNLVVVFRNQDLPVYLYLNDNDLGVKHHGWSFADLIKAEELRLNIEIERYAYFPYGTLDFSEAISPYEWQYLN